MVPFISLEAKRLLDASMTFGAIMEKDGLNWLPFLPLREVGRVHGLEAIRSTCLEAATIKEMH